MVKHMTTALDRRDERHQQSKIYSFSLENKLPRQLHSVGTMRITSGMLHLGLLGLEPKSR